MLSDILCAETTTEGKAKNLLFIYLDCLAVLMRFLQFVSVNISIRNKVHLSLNPYHNAVVFRIQLISGSERIYERSPVKNY